MREGDHAKYTVGDQQWYKFLKFHQKNAPKSMKNVRFESGFLHVIRKLIPQQDPNVPITLKPFVSEIHKSASSYRHGVQATNIESHASNAKIL